MTCRWGRCCWKCQEVIHNRRTDGKRSADSYRDAAHLKKLKFTGRFTQTHPFIHKTSLLCGAPTTPTYLAPSPHPPTFDHYDSPPPPSLRHRLIPLLPPFPSINKLALPQQTFRTFYFVFSSDLTNTAKQLYRILLPKVSYDFFC